MNKVQALDAFWNSFGWKAFDENTTPDNVDDKHISYESFDDDFGNMLVKSASLWDRSYSWKDIQLKEQEIANYISRGGRIVHYDGGAFWIKKGTPWAQRLDEPSDDTIRRIILNFELEYLD